jgi:hypothetical protein
VHPTRLEPYHRIRGNGDHLILVDIFYIAGYIDLQLVIIVGVELVREVFLGVPRLSVRVDKILM